jgi:glucosamine-6-phosphate deaminase
LSGLDGTSGLWFDDKVINLTRQSRFPMSNSAVPASPYENLQVEIFANAQEASMTLAKEVKALILERRAQGRKTVLGLATGSTPVLFYRELVRLHREEGFSFADVITFNLDEYYGLNRDHPESYWRFMHNQLFDHIDIPPSQIHLPDGMVPMEHVFEHCMEYEKAIQAAGGLQLQILGIGRTGHIGFNEPGSAKTSRTRLVSLDHLTRKDAAADFQGEENVPHFAITMGVGTILQAERVVLMAWGENKAEIVRKAVEEPETEQVSASFLQSHPQASFFINASASAQLTRIKLPWLVRSVAWDEPQKRRGVSWLSQKLGKAVLKLEAEHYNENGMAELVAKSGGVAALNISIFNFLQRTITGWPGGKAGTEGQGRPVAPTPAKKKVLILSPEPQDEVHGMGGTLERLVMHGHAVHVVYLASGDLRVTDAEAERFAETLRDTAALHDNWGEQKKYAEGILQELETKGAFGIPSPELRKLKSLIRRGEARDAMAALKLRDSQSIHFLDAKFYSQGRYRQFQMNAQDVAQLSALLAELEPNLLFATGNLADPSSVQGMAFRVFREAWSSLQSPWQNACEVWLYRGQQSEYETHEIDMAVPMAPDQLKMKLNALRRFQSQNLPEGTTSAQNRQTAHLYNKLGMAEYEAIEAFSRWQRK